MLLLTPATSKPANQHTTADPVSFSITKSWNQELVVELEVEGNCLIMDMANIMGEEQSDVSMKTHISHMMAKAFYRPG